MAALLGLRGTQRNNSGKQKTVLQSESNKENVPFEKQPTRKENHVEGMDVSPQSRGEVLGKNLSQVKSAWECTYTGQHTCHILYCITMTMVKDKDLMVVDATYWKCAL